MIQLIKDATTTGTGSAHQVGIAKDESQALHTVQVDFTGSPTALTVALEGSITNTVYQEIATHIVTSNELSDGVALFHIANKPVTSVRAEIVTLTGGVSPVVNIYYHKGIS